MGAEHGAEPDHGVEPEHGTNHGVEPEPGADPGADHGADPGELWLRLAGLPRADRAAALTDAVAAEFKTALLMAAHDDLPTGENLFDLGLTSVSAVDARTRLQEALGCEIGLSELFERPAVRDLVAYLVHGPAAALFPASAPRSADAAPTDAAPRLRPDHRAALQQRLNQPRRS